MNDTEFWKQAGVAIDSRLARLRLRPLPELAAITDDTAKDSEMILGRKVSFVHFARPIEKDQVIITIQASVRAFFGLGWRSREKGLVVKANGQFREATADEVDSTL